MSGEPSEAIEVFWVPGCSSCLRTKEFIERAGLPYVEHNLVDDLPARERLEALGLMPPAVVVGERGVPGLDLVGVAGLIGSDFVPDPILPAAVLVERFGAVLVVLRSTIRQLSDEVLDSQFPERPRTIRSLAAHAATTPAIAFLAAYDDCRYNGRLLPDDDLATSAGPDDLIVALDDTWGRFRDWWDRHGVHDPLETVVDTYNPAWGHRTLHEVLERSVWHTAQHTRQLTACLEADGVEPVARLTAEVLDGLPLPERLVS